jgi:hypothetical protein
MQAVASLDLRQPSVHRRFNQAGLRQLHGLTPRADSESICVVRAVCSVLTETGKMWFSGRIVDIPATPLSRRSIPNG